MTRPILLALAAVLALSVAGCGKKPQFVDPPQGHDADKFPHPYPNPSTDPKPGQTTAPLGSRFP